jgi:hypothetical protein
MLGLIFRRYPDFILSDFAQKLTEIPVFVFHEVTAEYIEPMFHFLAENKYATLTADEYIARQIKREKGQEREVLLTFDDGYKSLYNVAFPALKRFGLNAVAYIISGAVPEGQCHGVQDKTICNWDEIREMHESGIIDIQSHSMYHHSISISDRVLDFVRPRMNHKIFDDFMPFLQEENGVKDLYELEYGRPILEWTPRYSKARAFYEAPETVLACIDHVNRQGGSDYFRKRNWHSQLTTVMINARNKNPDRGYETDADQKQAIKNDFTNSRQMIESRLPGKKVEHFCYPWFHGSALAAEISAEVGFASNAWGSLLPNFARRNRRVTPISRLSSIYIWRLPGKGRKPLKFNGDGIFPRGVYSLLGMRR